MTMLKKNVVVISTSLRPGSNSDILSDKFAVGVLYAKISGIAAYPMMPTL